VGENKEERDDMWVVKIPQMSTAPAAADLWLLCCIRWKEESCK
jgi:hypothetical protein